VPVLLERGVRPPLGFGEVQAVDLSHWGGDASDPFFKDLVALVIAKRDGEPAPKPHGPAARAMRRFVFGGGLTALVLAALAFAWSTPIVREKSCALPVPGLARACCMAGFTEKIEALDEAWTPAPKELPDYLRNAETAFPSEGEARNDANARLTAQLAQTCTPLDPTTQRLASAAPRDAKWDCRQTIRGWVCAVDYVAVCQMEERRVVKRCPG